MQEHFGLEHHKTCCKKACIKKFYSHCDKYCCLKFLSHKVNARAFLLAQECLEKGSSAGQATASDNARVVDLTSFHNPVEMMVSQVNQPCNKNLEKRSEKVLQACWACLYHQHTDVWLEMIGFVTQQLHNTYQVSTWNTTVASHLWQNDWLHLLTIDAFDLDNYLQVWQPQLWKESNITRFNSEIVNLCRFAAPLDMLRTMSKSQAL